MLGKCIFACCSETDTEYEIRVYRGHIFRVYPGGAISQASAQEKELAKSWAEPLRSKWSR